jgi:hypothetical protein
MICNTCGRQIQNETANFCEYCGASFREQTQATRPEAGQPFYTRPIIQQGPVPMNFANPIAEAGQRGNGERPISFLSWLGTYSLLAALLFIPYLGWIGIIAILIFWAFSNKTPATKKNWARVTLIFAGLVMIFVIVVFAAFYSMYYPQIMNGTFDINSYYESMMNGLK